MGRMFDPTSEEHDKPRFPMCREGKKLAGLVGCDPYNLEGYDPENEVEGRPKPYYLLHYVIIRDLEQPAGMEQEGPDIGLVVLVNVYVSNKAISRLVGACKGVQRVKPFDPLDPAKMAEVMGSKPVVLDIIHETYRDKNGRPRTKATIPWDGWEPYSGKVLMEAWGPILETGEAKYAEFKQREADRAGGGSSSGSGGSSGSSSGGSVDDSDLSDLPSDDMPF